MYYGSYLNGHLPRSPPSGAAKEGTPISGTIPQLTMVPPHLIIDDPIATLEYISMQQHIRSIEYSSSAPGLVEMCRICRKERPSARMLFFHRARWKLVGFKCCNAKLKSDMAVYSIILSQEQLVSGGDAVVRGENSNTKADEV